MRNMLRYKEKEECRMQSTLRSAATEDGNAEGGSFGKLRNGSGLRCAKHQHHTAGWAPIIRGQGIYVRSGVLFAASTITFP